LNGRLGRRRVELDGASVPWRAKPWLNLVERFFGELTADVVREGSFQSTRELVRAIETYLAERNQDPKKYVWRASGLKILEKIRRAREALAAADIIST